MAEKKRSSSSKRGPSGRSSSRKASSTHSASESAGNRSGSDSSHHKKRLMRSRKDRVIAGVCGGIAEYIDADPTLVRLIVALLAIASGIFGAVVLYLVAWIIMPEE